MAATPTQAARANEEPQAALRFARAPDGQSYIARQRVGYPFHITRPFYFDEAPAGALTLYLQSVSGGIYQGEDLRMTCSADPGSAAHVTTQAATIVHRMPAAPARQTVALEAADGAFLEYLPDPLIMFPGRPAHLAAGHRGRGGCHGRRVRKLRSPRPRRRGSTVRELRG